MWPAPSSRYLSSVSEPCYHGTGLRGLPGHTRSPSGVTTYCQKGPSQIPWATAAFHRLQTQHWPSNESEACRWLWPLLLSSLFEPIPDVGIDQASGGQEDFIRTSEGTSCRAPAQGAIFPAVLLCSKNTLSPLRGRSEWIGVPFLMLSGHKWKRRRHF